jgi:hypothetical protein
MTLPSDDKTDTTPTPSAQPPPRVRRRKVRSALLHLQQQWRVYQGQLARPGILRATEERALARLTTIANQLAQLLPEARDLLGEAEVALWEHTALQMAQDARTAKTHRRRAMTTELRRQRALVEQVVPWLRSLVGLTTDERGKIQVPDVTQARVWWLRYYPDYVSPTGELLVELVYRPKARGAAPVVWASRWCRVPNWTPVPGDEEREPPIAVRPDVLAKGLQCATPSRQRQMSSETSLLSSRQNASSAHAHDERRKPAEGTDV